MYILNMWGEREECSIICEYPDNTLRIHIPKYNNNRYIGYEEETINKKDLIFEENEKSTQI